MSLTSFIRQLVRGRAPTRSAPRGGGFVPQVTELEGRAVPSGGSLAGPPGHSACVISADAGTLGQSGAPAAKGADAVTVPFKLTGGGPAPGGLPLVPGVPAGHTSTGTATHLGRHTGSGEFTLESPLVISATGEVTGTFSGTYTFVAANGDQLVMTYGDGVVTGQIVGRRAWWA